MNTTALVGQFAICNIVELLDLDNCSASLNSLVQHFRLLCSDKRVCLVTLEEKGLLTDTILQYVLE